MGYRKAFGAAFSMVFVFLPNRLASASDAWTESTGTTQIASMLPGEVKVFKFPSKIKAVFSGAGHIADVTYLADDTVVITAKSYGRMDVVGVSDEPQIRYLTIKLSVAPPPQPPPPAPPPAPRAPDLKIYHGVTAVREYNWTKNQCGVCVPALMGGQPGE